MSTDFAINHNTYACKRDLIFLLNHSWMQEMNHKQAEIVVGRALSEKMKLKNKTLIADYKKLKVYIFLDEIASSLPLFS